MPCDCIYAQNVDGENADDAVAKRLVRIDIAKIHVRIGRAQVSCLRRLLQSPGYFSRLRCVRC